MLTAAREECPHGSPVRCHERDMRLAEPLAGGPRADPEPWPGRHTEADDLPKSITRRPPGRGSTALTRDAYLDVWVRAAGLIKVVDVVRNPVEYAQALMFLHDAAQVFSRPDLALEYARKAVMALSNPGTNRVSEVVVRLRINALLAEVVSLNTLGLSNEAMTVIDQASRSPGYEHEPEFWLRSFWTNSSQL
jgi:hypothetical protein